jgi:NAD(P)-dependent dehydrogenase (short-subunit alcohol dehydrogenase family)
MSRLDGKTAIVTGAASGIGLACARRFAAEGAAVVGIDRQACGDWETATAPAPNNRLYRLDVTDGNALVKAVGETIADLGGVDILLTAAGIGDGGPVNMLDEASWDRVIDINLKGTFLAIKAVIDNMIERRTGSIITIASVEGINGTEGGSAYNASKGGVVLLSKNVAIDYGRVGIRCNTLCPGFIDTPLFNSVMDNMPEFKADIKKQIKLGRFGNADEIAGAACFLASDDASYVTGQSLVVDGGYTAGHSHGIVEMLGLV